MAQSTNFHIMDEENPLQIVRESWLHHDGITNDFLHYLVDHQGTYIIYYENCVNFI